MPRGCPHPVWSNHIYPSRCYPQLSSTPVRWFMSAGTLWTFAFHIFTIQGWPYVSARWKLLKLFGMCANNQKYFWGNIHMDVVYRPIPSEKWLTHFGKYSIPAGRWEKREGKLSEGRQGEERIRIQTKSVYIALHRGKRYVAHWSRIKPSCSESPKIKIVTS